MKKILLFIILAVFSITSINYTFAADSSSGITVKTTEKIPGASCGNTPDENGIRTCTVQKGLDGVYGFMSTFVKYFLGLGMLAGVLFIVINGIMLSMGGMDSSLKDKAKKNITGAITGIILLIFSGVILRLIAPWIFS